MASSRSNMSEYSSVSKTSKSIIKLHDLAKSEKWAVPSSEIEFLDDGKATFGEGAGGKVFKVRWRGLVCAAKKMHIEEKYKDERERDAMLSDLGNEIALLSSLRHPNLVMFLGACLEDELDPLLLMEYCEHGTLEAFLIMTASREKTVKKALKYQFIKELALGMTFLHQCQPPIVHRDLKPSNILLSKDYHVKITDFGLAKFLTANLKKKYRMTGETGSYRFMAPEVFKHEEYNETVDVYAYALIVYWIMSGIQPFSHIADPYTAVTLAAVDGMRPPVSHINNKEMSLLVQKCWSQNPSERPPFDKILSTVQTLEHEALKKKGILGS